MNALEPLLGEIRQVDDLRERVVLAETLVNLLSKEQPEACRKLLSQLLDDCIRVKSDASEDDIKRLDPDSLAKRIVRISANFDRKLAKSLLERYIDGSTFDRERPSSTGDVSRTRFFLSVASQLIEKDRVLAASIGETAISGPIVPETLMFLSAFRQKDLAIANRLFAVALRGVQSRGGRDPNELLLLFSFVFSPQQIPIVTTQGLGMYHLSDYAPPRDYLPVRGVANQYLEVTVQLLSDPARYSREDLQPTFGPAGDWFLIKIVEPKASVYRADLMNTLIAQQYVLEERLQTQRDNAAASLDRWNNLDRQNQDSGTNNQTVDYLLKRADQTTNSKRRDQLLYRAAMAAVKNQEYDRALDIANKLSSDYQKEAKQFLTFEIALAAIGKQDLDRAARLAERDEDLLRRAYVFTLIAKSLIERKDRDIKQARFFLAGVEVLLPKLDTDKDRVSALAAVAMVYSRFDKDEAFRSLQEVVRYANKVEAFAGETAVSRILDVGGFYFDYSLYADSSLSEVLYSLGPADFNRTLEGVRQLESRTARLKAIVAACRSILSTKTS